MRGVIFWYARNSGHESTSYHPYFSWLIFDEHIGGCALPFRKRQTPKARTSFCSSWRHHFGDWSLHDRNHPSLLWLTLAWVHRGLRVVFSDTTETKNTCFFLLIFSWFFQKLIVEWSLTVHTLWCWFQHDVDFSMNTQGVRVVFSETAETKSMCVFLFFLTSLPRGLIVVFSETTDTKSKSYLLSSPG